MKKSVIRKLFVFILTLCMVLTEGHLSYLGTEFGLGKGVGTAYAAVDWEYDDEYTLYNFVNVNSSGQYGILRRTYINTTSTLSEFAARCTSDRLELGADEFDPIESYDFSGEILYISHKTSSAPAENDGTYIFSGDVADYVEHPENYGEVDGFYYVTNEANVIFVKNKIGASGYTFLTEDNGFSLNPRPSYHRDYTIKIVKGLPVKQTLFNFLDIKSVSTSSKMFRLVKTSQINFAAADQNPNYAMEPNKNDFNQQLYAVMCPDEYDFSDVVLDITSGGSTVSYVYKPSSYTPGDEFFEPW